MSVKSVPTSISPAEKEVLFKIYVGQNVRKEGILQSEISDKQSAQALLSKNLVAENDWYLKQFLTTDQGSALGKELTLERIKERQGELHKKTRDMPKRVLGFFTLRYISKQLAFPTERRVWSSDWQDRILADGRIWIMWDRLLSALVTLGLSVKTYSYVSTRGGERVDLMYVISPETQKFLLDRYLPFDFVSEQESTLNLYPVLVQANSILLSDDADSARQRIYELLRDHELYEEQLAGIITDMSENRITSEYRGLLSPNKPFDIFDKDRFQTYLDKELIGYSVDLLMQGKDKAIGYDAPRPIPSLTEVKTTLGILDFGEQGEFYSLVRNLEWDLRSFIKEKLGKNWMKRIESDLPDVAKRWAYRKQQEKRWGVAPDEDPINYADFGDYTKIIENYGTVFSDGKDDLRDVLTQLRLWYTLGRNSIMHFRTINQEKKFATKFATNFLREWMRRKSEDITGEV